MSGSVQRPVEVVLGGACELTCAGLCDCRNSETDHRRLTKLLGEGGSRLTLRGAPAGHSKLGEYVKKAREGGFGEVVIRTNALPYAPPGAAQQLARQGVDGVIVPIFSQIPAFHDRIAGRQGALVQALVGIRALAAAGLQIQIEVPILDTRLQSLKAIVELVHRAVPTVKGVRFYVAREGVGEIASPPDWTTGTPALVEGLKRAKELGLEIGLRNIDAVPLCVLRDHPELFGAYKFNPRIDGQLAQGCSLPEVCNGCAAAKQCPGVAASYLSRHGTKGLVPWARRPQELYEQRTTPARKWDDQARKAAANTKLLVLRPTVNCNQDCTFCSANETSNNVWPDSGEMLRVIARAARRGVHRVAFSGGEPTLSKDLPMFVRTAHRVGVKEIEIVSNAVLLDEKKVKVLKESGLTHAFVSLHAHDERLSRVLTQKSGDFAKTVRGIKLLVEAGITTVLNHVISAKNYRFLPHYVDFVAREFGANKVQVSFAFLTPQYKGLENLDLLAKLSDAMPYLQRALFRAVELGVPFIVGSRQGVPPCFLGAFRGWSDVFDLANEAASEDKPQKMQGPACAECRYRSSCTGLWKPYVARYGVDELVPIRGLPYTNEEIRETTVASHQPPWGVPKAFSEVPEIVRDRDAEQRGAPAVEEVALAASISLPTIDLRSRPVRLAMLGSGRQARRLATGMRNVRGVSIDAIASPHAPDTELLEFGNCPSYRSATEALEDMSPEAVIVAATTHAHFDLAKTALEKGIPALVEKPLTRTEEEAEELLVLAAKSGAFVMPAHNDLFAPGLSELFALGRGEQVAYARRLPRNASEAPRAWGRAAFSETLYHALSVLSRACGGGVGVVSGVHVRGVTMPELVRMQVAFGESVADLVLDFAAQTDETVVTSRPKNGAEAVWRRSGRSLTLTRDGAAIPFKHEGSEIEVMVAAFRDAVLGKAPPPTTIQEALDVMRTTRAAIDAMAAAGAPFERPNAPKHVATRPERQAV